MKDGSGLEYVRALFRDQVADRIEHARAHEEPWHFYLRVLPLGLLPFFPIVLLGLAPGVRKSLGPAKAPLVVAACWLVLSVAIQSAFPGKRLLYCVPLVAPFAVICAAVLSSEARGALGFASGWVAFIGCIVFIAGGVLVAAGFDEWTFTEGRKLAEETIVDSLNGDGTTEAAAREPASHRGPTGPPRRPSRGSGPPDSTGPASAAARCSAASRRWSSRRSGSPRSRSARTAPGPRGRRAPWRSSSASRAGSCFRT